MTELEQQLAVKKEEGASLADQLRTVQTHLSAREGEREGGREGRGRKGGGR